MVEIYGLELSILPEERELVRGLRRALYEAWRAKHERVHEASAARGSLAGLVLLEHCLPNVGLCYDANGRPYARGADADFNLTHTAEHTFLALCRGADGQAARVGIDAENLSRVSELRISQMAERWFSPAEQTEFLSAPTAESFLRIWTRKEALVKWTGQGLRSLRDADTARAGEKYGVRFGEFRVGETVIATCVSQSTALPDEIHMLSRGELLAMGFSLAEA